MALPYEFDSPEFDQAVAAAGRQVFQKTLAARLTVFISMTMAST
jgi:hypothetical protein